MTYTYYYKAPLGPLRLTSNGHGLTGIWFEKPLGTNRYAAVENQKATLLIFEETKAWLDLYFSGQEPSFLPLLEIDTTPFRKRVWEILSTIPYGEMVTYGDIAKALSKEHPHKKMSAQAVGGAVGHNAFSIVIPCHRVIGQHGNLTGFGGGLAWKCYLLEREGIDVSTLHYPKKKTHQ